MASRSKSKAISPWNKASPTRNRAKNGPSANKSFMRTAMEKLRKQRANEECGENELATMAKDLIDQQCIMDIHFSEIVHHPVAERVDEKLEEQESEFVTSEEQDASKNRSIWRVEDTAKLEVKLLLRSIDTQAPRFARTAASLLQMEYGPLHTSLLINDTVLLEWNTSSLVVPERYDGINQHYPIMTSALHRVSAVSLIKYNPDDELDLIFEAARGKIEMLNALIKVISRYNGQYYYHAMSRNCQTFVIDALKAMGCKNLPQFQGSLHRYYQSLKAGSCQPEFENHEELDQYVRDNVLNPPEGQHMSAQEKEYLLGQYFLYHIPGMTESEEPELWKCPVRKCEMSNLERHIDEQSMILHRFLKIED